MGHPLDLIAAELGVLIIVIVYAARSLAATLARAEVLLTDIKGEIVRANLDREAEAFASEASRKTTEEMIADILAADEDIGR